MPSKTSSLKKPDGIIWTSFLHVLLGTCSIIIITWTGLMDSVATENGTGHYAERPFSPLLPEWLPMPFNTLINLVYTLVGVYWLNRAKLLPAAKPHRQKYMCAAFAWMSILYSLVQLLRILLQTHRFAVLDQWYTLPIFMWVVVWGLSLMSPFENAFPFVALMVTSCFSYFLALITEIGFELGLGAHILLSITVGCGIVAVFPSKRVVVNLFCACVCCCGFVVLKVMDLHLPRYSTFFETISGHFISKICDVGQIHYVAKFFESANLVNKEMRLKIN